MTLHQPNDIVAQRYRIVTALGKGGMGITYEAEDLTNYQRVALKVVSLREAKDWKILELFEREAKVIANLHHPQIPKYLDYFYIDTEQDRLFYLIRELVSGNSLANWVAKGWHPTEIQVKQVAIQILEILSYLHQLNSPIIHRDIKPENIILQPDGKIFLVDFGAVKDIYHNTMSMSGTFVGTVGYMPPEQLQGKAYCASDLYSLGGTLLYLLTHRSPDELPQKRMKIDFRSCVEISPEFADWLEVILEPICEDRFKSAIESLNALRDTSTKISGTSTGFKSPELEPANTLEEEFYAALAKPQRKPSWSRVTLKKTSRSLIVNIPPEDSIKLVLFFIVILISALIASGLIGISMPNFSIFVFPFFMMIFVVLLPIVNGLSISVSETQIQIYQKEFLIHWKYLVFSRKIRGKTGEIERYFQNLSSLDELEKEWLLDEISDFLGRFKS